MVFWVDVTADKRRVVADGHCFRAGSADVREVGLVQSGIARHDLKHELCGVPPAVRFLLHSATRSESRSAYERSARLLVESYLPHPRRESYFPHRIELPYLLCRQRPIIEAYVVNGAVEV